MLTPRRTLASAKNLAISATKLTRPLCALALVATMTTGSLGCAGNDGVVTAAGGGSGGTGLGTAGLGTAGSGTAGSGTGGVSSAGATAGGVAGLSGGSGGNSGGNSGNGGSGGSGSGAIEPTFAMLKGVIQMSCFGGVCHDLPEHPFRLVLDDKLYTTLTTHVTKTCGPVVKPGSPQDSALVKLLKGPCGETERMPYNKCVEDADEGCVRPEYIAAIEQWIAKGAPP